MSLVKIFVAPVLLFLTQACTDNDNRVNNLPSIEVTDRITFNYNEDIEPLIIKNNTEPPLTSCIAKNLPSGLVISLSNTLDDACILTGRPNIPQALTSHQITVTNDTGSIFFDLEIAVNPPPMTLALINTKHLQFSWEPISGIDQYRLYGNFDSQSGFQLIEEFSAGMASFDYQVPLFNVVNSQYLLEYCISAEIVDCAATEIVTTGGNLNSLIDEVTGTTVKINDDFGSALAISDDGTTLAIGARGDAGALNDQVRSGAVYIFKKNGLEWDQQTILRASNSGTDDFFGYSIDLNSDGSILAVGSPREDSDSSGFNGEDNNNLGNKGAAYIFSRDNNDSWSQTAYLKSTNMILADQFGYSVSLSDNGQVLAVSAPYFEPTLEISDNTGAVYIFNHDTVNSIWQQTNIVMRDHNIDYNGFGKTDIRLSGDGKTLVVGAENDKSAATGINGDPTDTSLNNSGAAFVFVETLTGWHQQAYIKSNNPSVSDYFGHSLALSNDGNKLIIGAPKVNSFHQEVEIQNSGSIYSYERVNDQWHYLESIENPYPKASDDFSSAISLSGDGHTLVVGVPLDECAEVGITTEKLSCDGNVANVGTAYIYQYISGQWQMAAHLRAPSLIQNQNFGESVALSADGKNLIISSQSLGKAYLY